MSEVEYDVTDGIAEIRLNRPPVNALSLELVEGGEHEILMELPAIRNAAMDGIEKLFLGTVTT